MRSTPYDPAPPDPELLAGWVSDRIREPNQSWHSTSPRARSMPRPVNLPGMDRALAAVLAKYWSMPPEWCADLAQEFMGSWLLRPESAHTIARSALRGLERGTVASLEAGIAWKLRMEILSQAHRAYLRDRRRRDLRAEMLRMVAAYREVVRQRQEPLGAQLAGDGL